MGRMTSDGANTATARITSTSGVMSGKPCVAGTRITVEMILRRFAEGYTVAMLLDDYPHLTEDGIIAALEYAADLSAHPPGKAA